MISTTLLRKEIKSNYKIMLIFLAVLTMYAAMIVSMFDPRLGDSLKGLQESMSGLFAAFGMNDSGTTLLDFLVNYLYGFLFVVFPMIFILMLSGRLVTRYVDRGSMTYLLATPNTRGKIVRTQLLVLLLAALSMVLYVTGLCILCSEGMFPGELDIAAFINVNIGLYGLHIFLIGICFFCSCLFSDSRMAAGASAGLCIAFFLLQMMAQAGDKYEFLKYATPLTLFQPERLAAGDGNAYLSMGVLFVSGLLLTVIGSGIFCKKDLSI